MSDFLSLAPAQSLALYLNNDLSKRLQHNSAINFVRQANDAQGYPMLFCSVNGNEAEGQPVVLVRIVGVDCISKDIFNNQIISAAPMLMEFAYELNSSSFPIPSAHDLAIISYEAQKRGCQFELIQIANGTAVNEASSNAAVPVIKLDDLYWPDHGV
jgi:hypothetical protein